jgi:hypothetical protein
MALHHTPRPTAFHDGLMPWEIRWHDVAPSDTYCGTTVAHQHVVNIWTEGYDLMTLRTVLLHELLHVAMHAVPLLMVEDPVEMEEQFVGRADRNLLILLRLNPDVVAWLTAV